MKRVLGGLLIAGLMLAPTVFAATADKTFHRIYSREWAWRNGTRNLEFRGHKLPDNSRLDSVSAADQAERLAYWTHVLKELDAIDPQQLTQADQVNYAVYHEQIRNRVADQRFRTWQMPFNSDSAFWSSVGYQLGGDSLHSVRDYRQYIAKLKQIPRYFDQQIANMKLGLKRGFSVPRAVLDGRDRSIASVAGLGNAKKSSFYTPFRSLPDRIPAATRARLKQAAAQAIKTDVIPAYSTLLTFFRNDYVPHARTTLAAEALPDGKAYYRQQIREYTTLDKSPDAIHALGLKQVKTIHAQMMTVMHHTGFKGSFPQFLHMLRTNPRFYAKTPQELLDKTAWVAKEVDGQLSRFFDHLPRERFAIKPVPADIAPYYTSGRGGPGVYLVNTYDLEARPLYSMPALTLHESYPGHALQLELAQEATNQPAFRRDSYISAYGEGWALYCEYLGNEMGIYQTDYQRFGFLSYQMWRAVRLVVDTGIHHMGWSRKQAVDYMLTNTALSKPEIENEVDRYISWPAQALSYELGYLQIRRLRAKARKALGTKFDLAHFHDTILEMGSVPLPVLARRIDRFIAAGGPEPDWGCACAPRPGTSSHLH